MQDFLITLPGDENTPPNHQKRVEQLASFGVTQEDIAAELEISLQCIQDQYQREFERGQAAGKIIVLEKLFQNASSGSNMAATSLWVKARCGWRDTGSASASPTVIYSILNVRPRPDGTPDDQPRS